VTRFRHLLVYAGYEQDGSNSNLSKHGIIKTV